MDSDMKVLDVLASGLAKAARWTDYEANAHRMQLGLFLEQGGLTPEGHASAIAAFDDARRDVMLDVARARSYIANTVSQARTLTRKDLLSFGLLLGIWQRSGIITAAEAEEAHALVLAVLLLEEASVAQDVAEQSRRRTPPNV